MCPSASMSSQSGLTSPVFAKYDFATLMIPQLDFHVCFAAIQPEIQDIARCLGESLASHAGQHSPGMGTRKSPEGNAIEASSVAIVDAAFNVSIEKCRQFQDAQRSPRPYSAKSFVSEMDNVDIYRADNGPRAHIWPGASPPAVSSYIQSICAFTAS